MCDFYTEGYWTGQRVRDTSQSGSVDSWDPDRNRDHIDESVFDHARDPPPPSF